MSFWFDLITRNLEPGGWIEEVELDIRVYSDDSSLPSDSLLAGWGPLFLPMAERAGRSLLTQEKMKGAIERAGFKNVQDNLFKCPIGPWPKDEPLKEAGRINLEHWSAGIEGWALRLLTMIGDPEPWSVEEAMVYFAKVRQELRTPGLHAYHYS